MPTQEDIEQADAAIVEARAAAESQLGTVLRDINKGWSAWAEATVRKAIVGQPGVTNPMDVADATTLKFNLSEAIKSGSHSVESLFGDALDIELNVPRQGGMRPSFKLQGPKAKLATNLYGLLNAAGYNMQPLRTGPSYNYEAFTGDDVLLDVEAPVRTYGLTLMKLGDAIRHAAQLRHDKGAEDAAAKWDSL